LELCCREPYPSYPITIPVYIRGHPPLSSQSQSFPPQNQQQQGSRAHSRTSITPSVVGGIVEEQLSTLGKKTFRPRISSTGQSGILIGITGLDNESTSFSNTGISIFNYIHSSIFLYIGQEPSKIFSSFYKTFHLINDGDYFRPKLLVDSINNETEPIDQITALYMRGIFLKIRISFNVHRFSLAT